MSEDTNGNGVRITMRDVYLEVRRQGEILSKLASTLPDTDEKVDDHEVRIRKLEQKAGWLFGAIGLLGAIVGIFSFSVGP